MDWSHCALKDYDMDSDGHTLFTCLNPRQTPIPLQQLSSNKSQHTLERREKLVGGLSVDSLLSAGCRLKRFDFLSKVKAVHLL